MNTLLGKSLRTDTDNWAEPNNQLTIVHFKQATGPRHNGRNYIPIGILNSGIDVTRYVRNIDNHTGMKPQGPIVTTIPESNREKNCSIFDLIRKTLYIS